MIHLNKYIATSDSWKWSDLFQSFFTEKCKYAQGQSVWKTTMSILQADKLIEQVKFDEKGLVGAIVQDHQTGEVLMFAWMNTEALEKTLLEKRACYWSRSRKKLWIKGESSGHTQKVLDVRLDCDGDAILLTVDQQGGACHTGHRSCFYRTAEGDRWREDSQPVFDADSVYGSGKQ